MSQSIPIELPDGVKFVFSTTLVHDTLFVKYGEDGDIIPKKSFLKLLEKATTEMRCKNVIFYYSQSRNDCEMKLTVKDMVWLAEEEHRSIYVQLRDNFTKESLVSLQEHIETSTNYQQLVIWFPRNHVDRAALAEILVYYGFAAYNPKNPPTEIETPEDKLFFECTFKK